MEKWYRSYLSRGDMYQGRAYWSGGDNVVRYMPHLLVKQLGNIEKYWRTWLYDKDSIKEQIRKWMERGRKSQLPCAQGMSRVSSPDSPPGLDGYHFMGTFSVTEWSPVMMSVETIPLSKREEMEWSYFAAAVVSYCYAEKKMVFGKSPGGLFFNAPATESPIVDTSAELERLAMVQQAVCHLYGK